MALSAQQITGLNAASARKLSGKANATDLKNLEYAAGQGYKYVSPLTAPAPIAPVMTPQVAGLQAAEARQKAGTANATDIQNLNYAKSKGIDYSGVSSIADANAAINGGQAADAAGATASGEPPTRKTTAEIMADITKVVTPAGKTNADGTVTPVAPGASTLAKDLTDYRSSYGVTDLETQLSDLKTQQNDLLAASKKQSFAERSKTVAMNVINGRISQEEQAANERLTVLNNSITTITDQLNTKYKVIDSLMSAKQIDYNNAVASYNTQMTTNIAMFNAAKSVEENAKSDEEKAIDTARSNAQITLNALTAAGTTYDKLTSDQQTNLIKLGVQSGLGANFFSTVLKVSAGKDILTTITSEDKSNVAIIYKDGTTKNISVGGGAGNNNSIDGNNVSGIKDASGNFVKYSSPEEGLKATSSDIAAKQKGNTRTNLNANSTLEDFNTTWTGEINPGYTAQNLADYLNQNGYSNITPQTKFSSINADDLALAVANFETGWQPGDTITKPITSSQKKAIEKNLVSQVGADGYVSPQDYGLAKQDWITAGGSPNDFDTYFADRRNPKNNSYEVAGKSSSNPEVSPTDETAITDYKNQGYTADDITKAGFDKATVDKVFTPVSNSAAKPWWKFW